MWFIGKHTRSLRDFLEGLFPAKDKCPPTHRPLPPFYSHSLNKYYCVHTPYHGCHRRSDLPVGQICLYPLGMKSVCLRPSSLVHSPELMKAAQTDGL